MASQATQRTRNIGGDGGLFGDDQTFGHGPVMVIRVKGGQMISKHRRSGKAASGSA
jgi:hypothetical protein